MFILNQYRARFVSKCFIMDCHSFAWIASSAMFAFSKAASKGWLITSLGTFSGYSCCLFKFVESFFQHEKLNHPLDPKLEHLCARRGTPGYQPGSGSILVPLHQTTPISLPERVTKSEDCTPSPSPSPPPKSNSLSPQQQQSCAQLDSLEALTEAALLRINQRGM